MDIIKILTILVLITIIAVIISCLFSCKKENNEKRHEINEGKEGKEGYTSNIIDYFRPPLTTYKFPINNLNTYYTSKQPNDVTGGECRANQTEKCITQGILKQLGKREIFNRYIQGLYSSEEDKDLRKCIQNAPIQEYCVNWCYETANPKECIKQMCWQNQNTIESCFYQNCVNKCDIDDTICIDKCQKMIKREDDD